MESIVRFIYLHPSYLLYSSVTLYTLLSLSQLWLLFYLWLNSVYSPVSVCGSLSTLLSLSLSCINLNLTPIDILFLHHPSNSRQAKIMRSTKFFTHVSFGSSYNTWSFGNHLKASTQSLERIPYPGNHLRVSTQSQTCPGYSSCHVLQGCLKGKMMSYK
jgi:hypothetical protein